MTDQDIKTKAKELLATQNYGTDYWSIKRQELLNDILTKDISTFLTWNVMTETMYVHNSSYGVVEYNAVLMSSMRKYLKASPIGSPAPSNFNKESCPNHIHILYHLQAYESNTYGKVGNYNSFVEFGGGYGCMARAIKTINPNAHYTIFDFPEFNLIQKYFLEQNGITDVEFVSDFDDVPTETDMLIATWSLSESPMEVRQKFLKDIQVRNFLFAFQEKFESVDNNSFFTEMQRTFPANWKQIPIPHLPQVQKYLFGTN